MKRRPSRSLGRRRQWPRQNRRPKRGTRLVEEGKLHEFANCSACRDSCQHFCLFGEGHECLASICCNTICSAVFCEGKAAGTVIPNIKVII
jgi:hypothetical protein